MNENDIYPEDPTTEVAIDLDDVEGHGLKEVAAGLGAAAVLAGGAAGATQLAASSASVHPSTPVPSSVTLSVGDPVGTANHTMDGSITTAQSTRDGAISQADSKVDHAQGVVVGTQAKVGGIVDTTLTGAHNTVHATKTWATTDVKDAATGLVKGEVRGTQSTANATTASASTTADGAKTTATTKADHATTTAGSTVRSVDRKTATILSVVTTTAADGIHTAKVTLHAADEGVSASAGTGWVLIKAGDTVLAQVHMTGGQATASWTMPVVGGHSVTVSYTGDNVFASSARTVAL